MAIGIHVARVEFVAVNPRTNLVVDKGDVNTKLSDVLCTTHEHRVVADPDIPSSAGRPTVKRYLELEASFDYKLQYMDQNTVITYAV